MYAEEIIERNLARFKRLNRTSPIPLTRQTPEASITRAAAIHSLWDKKTGNLARDLTVSESEFIQSEMVLCRLDFRYWVERYAYAEIDPSSGGGFGPVKLWPSQARALEIFGRRELELEAELARYKKVRSRGILAVLHKVRQVGLTKYMRDIINHRRIFYRNFRDLSATLASPNDQAKNELFARDLNIQRNLPFFMRPQVLHEVKGEQFSTDGMGGRAVYTDSEQRAGIGTGAQYDGHHITECALWSNLERLIFSFIPSIPRGRYVVGGWESTANGRDDTWHSLTEDVRHKRRGYEDWVYTFIPWYLVSDKYSDFAPDSWTPDQITLKHAEMIENTSPEFNDGITAHPTRDQLYWWETQYFFHKGRRRLGVFYSNYPATPEESFQNVYKGAFDYETLEFIRQGSLQGMPYEIHLGKVDQNDPLVRREEDLKDSSFPQSFYVGEKGSLHKFDISRYDGDPRGLFWMWEPPSSRERYVVGADPSQGRPGWTRDIRNGEDEETDNSAIVVLRVGKVGMPDVQVGEYASPVDAFDCGYIANILGRVYGGTDDDAQAKLIHEAYPGPGPGTTRTLAECGYANLWHWEYFADANVKPTQTIGWQASPRNNTALWTKVSRIIGLRECVFKSPWLYSELASAIIPPGEFWPRVDPGNARHDDRMRAAFLALWAANGWSLERESLEEIVSNVNPGAVEWAHTDMSAEDIREAWNDRFDAIMRSGEGTRRR